MLLVSENTSGLPGGREDLERSRLFLWLELNAPINESFSFGVSVYGNIGTWMTGYRVSGSLWHKRRYFCPA